jgi:serine/threonine-protein kinase
MALFRAEAETVAQLQHANIVHIYDIGEHDGFAYLTLEYVQGGNLSNTLAGRPQPGRQAAQLVQTLAHAIHAAHLRGIVHRDLKPADILLQTEDSRSEIVAGRTPDLNPHLPYQKSPTSCRPSA